MVDIYDIVPQDKVVQIAPAPSYAYAGQEGERIARYQTLLSKLSSHDDLASVARVDWGVPEDDSTIELQHSSATAAQIRPAAAGSEALVGNFTDATAVMR